MRLSRLLAALLGIAVCALSLVAVPGALSSATAAAPVPGNIDLNAVGSITLHKLVQPAGGTTLPNDGSEIPSSGLSGLTPLAGVTFTLQRVNVDLSDPAVWPDLDKITVADAQAELTGTPASRTTDGSGIATFDNLAVGLYLITETDPGANNVSFHGDPFLVTVPLSVTGGWLYDVHVYPKNTVTPITKSVDDSAAHVLGDTVTWTITSQVPAVPAPDDLTAFGFTDTLDTRLAYAAARVSVGGTTYVENSDYTVAQAGQRITLTFTAAGLARLRLVQGQSVVVGVDTRVTALGDGTIPNVAAVFVNDPANDFVSGPAVTSWGALQIVKHALGHPSKRLKGAHFDLYATGSDGKQTGSPLAGSPFVTDADGEVTVPGLKAGTYVLVETKAPKGYGYDDSPITVTVTAGSLTQASVVRVGDPKIPGPQSDTNPNSLGTPSGDTLPNTGSPISPAMVAAGVGLILAGLVLMLARRRSTPRG